MLKAWIEILPLFVVRWLAKRLSERFKVQMGTGNHTRTFAQARPDVFFKVEEP